MPLGLFCSSRSTSIPFPAGRAVLVRKYARARYAAWMMVKIASKAERTENKMLTASSVGKPRDVGSGWVEDIVVTWGMIPKADGGSWFFGLLYISR